MRELVVVSEENTSTRLLVMIAIVSIVFSRSRRAGWVTLERPDDMGSRLGEVITLQFGGYANWTGSHFWNFQVRRPVPFPSSLPPPSSCWLSENKATEPSSSDPSLPSSAPSTGRGAGPGRGRRCVIPRVRRRRLPRAVPHRRDGKRRRHVRAEGRVLRSGREHGRRATRGASLRRRRRREPR